MPYKSFDLESRPNPDALDHFSVLDRYCVCLLRVTVIARGRNEDRARSAQREAERNDRDFYPPTHDQIPTLSQAFHFEVSPRRRR
jgi:hypothetical protein